jgi:hypothetical protein
MTRAQIDLAYRCASELVMYARAIDQYGNQRIAACMRNASDLLTRMVEEAELTELPTPKRQENSDVFPGFRGNNES